jgi:hypothetical protein
MSHADARHIVAMFIRKATRKYKGRVYTNYQVEDALQGQPGLFEGSREPEVEQIVRQVQGPQGGNLVPVVGRRGDADEDLIAIHADRVQVEYASEAGPVHVGYQFWKRLGLDAILRGLEFSEEPLQPSTDGFLLRSDQHVL